MSRRPRFVTGSTDLYLASADEADVLATFKDYANRLHGLTWHIRYAKGQDVEGKPDIELLVPACDTTKILRGDFEIKIGDDTVSPMQTIALDLIGRVDRMVSGVIRIGRLRPGELTLSEALDRIEEARRW